MLPLYQTPTRLSSHPTRAGRGARVVLLPTTPEDLRLCGLYRVTVDAAGHELPGTRHYQQRWLISSLVQGAAQPLRTGHVVGTSSYGFEGALAAARRVLPRGAACPT
ncbi:hypothetical protein [Deinococcus rufus]|uniref:Uncharacterized protein n=1 Tax=Deinococcus rufus TaxID=2136097 RepID=A0ABV7ZBK2_9DEIO